MEYIYLHGSLGVTQDLEAEGNIQKDTREKRERSETKAFIVTPFQSASGVSHLSSMSSKNAWYLPCCRGISVEIQPTAEAEEAERHLGSPSFTGLLGTHIMSRTTLASSSDERCAKNEAWDARLKAGHLKMNDQLMVNWWFGFLGSILLCYLGIFRGIPRIPNHKLTISWGWSWPKKKNTPWNHRTRTLIIEIVPERRWSWQFHDTPSLGSIAWLHSVRRCSPRLHRESVARRNWRFVLGCQNVKQLCTLMTGWWFKHFFHLVWEDESGWLISFRWVETTPDEIRSVIWCNDTFSMVSKFMVEGFYVMMIELYYCWGIYIYIFPFIWAGFFLSADFHGFSCAKLQSSGSGKNDSSNAASWQNLEIETPAVLFVHWFQDPCMSVQVVKRKVLHSSVYVDIYIYIYVWYVFRWK